MHNGEDQNYEPDFLAQLRNGTTLVIEIKGGGGRIHNPDALPAKNAASEKWCAAVSTWGPRGPELHFLWRQGRSRPQRDSPHEYWAAFGRWASCLALSFQQLVNETVRLHQSASFNAVGSPRVRIERVAPTVSTWGSSNAASGFRRQAASSSGTRSEPPLRSRPSEMRGGHGRSPSMTSATKPRSVG